MPEAERLVKEALLAEECSLKELERKFKGFYSLTANDLPPVRMLDQQTVQPFVLMWLLTAHEGLSKVSYREETCVKYSALGLRPEAEAVLVQLDGDDFQTMLRTLAMKHLGLTGKSKKMFLAYPICRYAKEPLMAELTKIAPSWRSSASGNDAPPLRTFRSAVIYSHTRSAMMFADKLHNLDDYAHVRGTDVDTIRDQFLSDVGIDAQGAKVYDLGNQAVTIRLQKDLSFLVELPSGKTAKSLPKKGADEAKYAAANSDFSQIKKAAKQIVKHRSKILFEQFLSGHGRESADWKEAYLNNPLLASVAKLLVWTQNAQTFTLGEAGSMTVSGDPYTIAETGEIFLAHPMEMKQEDVTAWQNYLLAQGLKQPFEQMWEPVIDPTCVTSDRYAGSMIPYYRFLHQEKHGIYVTDEAFHRDMYIHLKDCDAYVQCIDWRRHDIRPDDRFEIRSFNFRTYTRQVNHLVAYFDRITVYDRILKDDVSVVADLPHFTLAQITEFIKLAGENNCHNVTAILLDFRQKHFPDFDPLAEFTLD